MAGVLEQLIALLLKGKRDKMDEDIKDEFDAAVDEWVASIRARYDAHKGEIKAKLNEIFEIKREAAALAEKYGLPFDVSLDEGYIPTALVRDKEEFARRFPNDKRLEELDSIYQGIFNWSVYFPDTEWGELGSGWWANSSC